ncbi:PSD1 and planctomycete cytochrome C domain-containing protein [Aeoliella sp. ICT_H6.2]|uniref:PSD1 and planctomycete cytochrome C domain-containing protein n=1 Tax=Aeoliella straminimaris TaxID=2954799 RepID=A0A9X2F6W2_9BACT|nr:PSD1 and planctomycete cytochrome C domain-containing protein [Aeoliella straminimaris]MCO6043385.1 PSD1 and planctomycete cytochrome C domain-containing protein [Aeoliella straminimaris]
MNLKAVILTPVSRDNGPTNEPIKKVSYGADIRPILSDRCFQCHGPDEASRKADLRLDVRESAIGSAIVSGDAGASEVVARITSDDPDLQMPPVDSNKKPLSSEEIELLTQWIDEGAIYQKHWSFRPPKKPEMPDVGDAKWRQHPIDRLVFATLKQRSWKISPRADRWTLLRRATFDLTGLPPTRKQLTDFLSDDSPEAWSRAIDQLLASPAYGEHQARYWLDAARYADSHGYQYDFRRDQWAWRDWVIQAYNDNKPFDEFTIEQLAGDLLPQATEQQKLATGFNRNHPITVEGGVIDEEYRVEYVIDRTSTTGTTWLGLTVSCARCHDHKFDPFPQREFYEFTAFFNQVPEKGMNGFEPQARIPSPYQVAAIESAEHELREARLLLDDAFEDWAPNVEAFERRLLGDHNEEWQILVPDSVSSLNGTELSVNDHGRVFAEGAIPDQDVYEVTIPVEDHTVYGISLTALPTSSTPTGGLGRSANGNFVLSELTVEYLPSERDERAVSVPVKSAFADYSQAGYDAALAADGKIDQSGWAVHGRQNETLTASFQLKEPLQASERGHLRITLHFASQYTGHQLGCFQFAFASKQVLPLGDARLNAIRVPAQKRTREQQRAVRSLMIEQGGPDFVKDAWNHLTAAQERRDQLQAEIPKTMIMRDMEQSRGTYVLERGEYDKRREQVQPSTPSMLPPMPEDFPRNRLGLARWLTMPNHPLTARVAANRIWTQLFGLGLCETPEDFGLQSSVPVHLELLDWLAIEYVESGWDTKALLKNIMLSETYRQSSSVTQESYARDPENRYLSRGPRMRMDAEVIRDTALSASGLLNRKIGGASVFPYHPKGLWLEVNNRPGFSSKYEQDSGDKLYRRSIYTYWKRTVPPPSMAVFDAPSREYCQIRRSRTNTPLQAFVLLHDPQFVEAARALAERMLTEGGETTEEQIRFGMEVCLGRPPTVAELEVLLDTNSELVSMYSASPDKAKDLLSVGESKRDTQLPLSEHAAMTSVARLMLNLSEFITKN